MPSAWSETRDRQFEHIKESEMDKGKSPTKAEEIAARTVNKQRRIAGETPQKTTQGTGNPNTPLTERSKAELYNLAKQRNIKGRSDMRKNQLIKALRDSH